MAGYVSLPSLSRSNRNQIDLFLNRRHIQDRTLTFAVTEAYRNRLMVGRCPVAVVLIDLDPSLVDVNVHPAKAEVRFQDERSLFRAVQKAIIATLTEHAPAPEVRPDAVTWAVEQKMLIPDGMLLPKAPIGSAALSYAIAQIAVAY